MVKKLGNYQKDNYTLTQVSYSTKSGNVRDGWLLATSADGEIQKILIFDWSGVLELRNFIDEVIKVERGEDLKARNIIEN